MGKKSLKFNKKNSNFFVINTFCGVLKEIHKNLVALVLATK